MNKLAVIGVGKMGMNIAKFAKKEGGLVVTFDNRGNKINGIKSANTLNEAVNGVKIVLLAVSLKNTATVLAKLAPMLNAKQILVEITGVKAPFTPILGKMRCKVLRLHPLFGDFNDLKEKNIVIVKWKNPVLEKKAKIGLQKLGARVSIMDVLEHDKIMAERQLPAYLMGNIFWKMTKGTKKDELTPAMKKMRLLSEEIMEEWPLYESMLRLNPNSGIMLEKIDSEVMKWKKKLNG
jgi:prephenate dehydrogenase